MNQFCQDRDLLGIEPGMFLTSSRAGSKLIAGNNGVLSGATFTSSGANFPAAGVETGMVLVVYATIPSEGRAYEIVSVGAAGQLTVSVLRASPDDSPIAPPAGTALQFFVLTYSPQIRRISGALAEKLRATVEASPVASADFSDSAQLRQTAACGTLATILVAQAEEASPDDPNWAKAEHYRREFANLQTQLRLAVDIDGDGLAEQTRTLGNVRLRRV
jgi:hypothetical protein